MQHLYTNFNKKFSQSNQTVDEEEGESTASPNNMKNDKSQDSLHPIPIYASV